MSRYFSAVPPACAGDRRLGASELRVLIAIAASADQDGKAFLRSATIAERAGILPGLVSRSIAKLEAFGWLRRASRSRGSADYEIIYSPKDASPEMRDDIPAGAKDASPEMRDDIAPDAATHLPRCKDASPEMRPITTSPSTSPSTSPKNGQRFAPDTELPPSWLSWATLDRPDLDPDRVFERFRDYWSAIPGKAGVSANWTATWRNWLRRERAPAAPVARQSRASSISSYQAPPDPEATWQMRAKGYGQMLSKGMSLSISVTDNMVRRLVREHYATREQAERAGYRLWSDDDDNADAGARAA